MTPTEKALFQMHLFDLGDVVEIADSGIEGEITGLRVAEGDEDTYRVLFTDRTGVPRETWWRGSLLSSADDDDNVVCFACEKAAREATKH